MGCVVVRCGWCLLTRQLHDPATRGSQKAATRPATCAPTRAALQIGVGPVAKSASGTLEEEINKKIRLRMTQGADLPSPGAQEACKPCHSLHLSFTKVVRACQTLLRRIYLSLR